MCDGHNLAGVGTGLLVVTNLSSLHLLFCLLTKTIEAGEGAGLGSVEYGTGEPLAILFKGDAAHVVGLDVHIGDIGFTLLIKLHGITGTAAVQRNLTIVNGEYIMQGQYRFFTVAKIFEVIEIGYQTNQNLVLLVPVVA